MFTRGGQWNNRNWDIRWATNMIQYVMFFVAGYPTNYRNGLRQNFREFCILQWKNMFSCSFFPKPIHRKLEIGDESAQESGCTVTKHWSAKPHLMMVRIRKIFPWRIIGVFPCMSSLGIITNCQEKCCRPQTATKWYKMYHLSASMIVLWVKKRMIGETVRFWGYHGVPNCQTST